MGSDESRLRPANSPRPSHRGLTSTNRTRHLQPLTVKGHLTGPTTGGSTVRHDGRYWKGVGPGRGRCHRRVQGRGQGRTNCGRTADARRVPGLIATLPRTPAASSPRRLDRQPERCLLTPLLSSPTAPTTGTLTPLNVSLPLVPFTGDATVSRRLNDGRDPYTVLWPRTTSPLFRLTVAFFTVHIVGGGCPIETDRVRLQTFVVETKEVCLECSGIVVRHKSSPPISRFLGQQRLLSK